MRHRRGSLLMRLRRHRPAGWLAVLLLSFQVLLTADHLGASAARAFSTVEFDRALGLLELCHGDGTPVSGAADPDAPVRPAPPCILCSVAGLAANGIVATPPVLPVPVAMAIAAPRHTVPDGIIVRSPLRYGTERGPPVSVLV